MTGFLAGLELVEPGLVTVPEWRPEAGARREAKRMVGDALLIWPDYPPAKTLLEEMT